MEREGEAGDCSGLSARLQLLVQHYHRVFPLWDWLYLGDEGLPAGQAEQPGGHQLVGIHIHQVEVDEPAACPPRPHTDVQVLDAVGREKEGTIRIHLQKPTWSGLLHYIQLGS